MEGDFTLAFSLPHQFSLKSVFRYSTLPALLSPPVTHCSDLHLHLYSSFNLLLCRSEPHFCFHKVWLLFCALLVRPCHVKSLLQLLFHNLFIIPSLIVLFCVSHAAHFAFVSPAFTRSTLTSPHHFLPLSLRLTGTLCGQLSEALVL